MLFNSVSFLIFFPIVTAGYFIIPQKAKNLWLLVASYYFYMSWQPVYALLIFFSTATTFLCAVLLDKTTNPGRRRLILALNIFINIAILFYFKYFNFFVEILLSLFPSLSIAKNNNMLAVVGISFYTLQSLGYSIDVYTGKIKREKNFLTYALFVSFFPQLVAGPIERSTNFLPQLHRTYKFDYNRVTDGLVMMAWGFFKKLVVADSAALIINAVYNNVTAYSGFQLVMATFLFAFQVYGDFSGYSDIAIGAANVLGFKLMRNFNFPYCARSLAEFWERWHISLSRWFEDYIYQPFVWSAKNKQRATYIGFVLVFAISGLWHGAQWTYVAWGLIHAFYRVAGAATRKKRKKFYKKIGLSQHEKLFDAGRILTTFALVDFTYIFFRANSIADAVYVVKNMFSGLSGIFTPGYIHAALAPIGFYDNNGIAVLVCILIMLVVEAWQGKDMLCRKINRCKWPVRWAFYYGVLILIAFFGYFGQSQFIYFQF